MCDQITSQSMSIVWYEKYPDLRPGVQYFDCERLSASITHDACRKNWNAAHEKFTDETPRRLIKCQGCAVGRALHSDNDVSQTWQDVRTPGECARCGRRDLRIITSTGTCVSCWNRRRETERGFNARGRPMGTPINLHSWRVGLIGEDEKPIWRRFDAYHEGEAISRAVHQIDGAKFHDQQPGKAVWNSRVNRWQYRCEQHIGEFGTLVEHKRNDGNLEYICPVCRPNAAKGLPAARVCRATSLSSPEFIRDVVTDTNISEVWTATAYICNRCQHYAIQARRRAGRIQARCPLCDS